MTFTNQEKPITLVLKIKTLKGLVEVEHGAFKSLARNLNNL